MQELAKRKRRVNRGLLPKAEQVSVVAVAMQTFMRQAVSHSTCPL